MVRKRITFKKRFYIMVGIILLLGIYFINSTINFYRYEQLVYASENHRELSFKPSVELTKWHNKESKYVYLTFDDGPSRNSQKILDILDQYDIPATFFVLGASINANSESREILNRMIEEGHYIGLHSMTHDKNILYGSNGPTNFVKEMTDVKALVSKLTDGFESSICRAPYGTGGGTFNEGHLMAIQQANIKCWDWDVDSLDWKYSQDSSTVFQIVQNQTQINHSKNNLIVLFHEKDSTVAVLPEVIRYYQDLGYEFLSYNDDNLVDKMFFKFK